MRGKGGADGQERVAQEDLPLLNDFLTWKPIAPKGANELARVSARLCRFLRDEVLEQLNASEKNAKLTELKGSGW